MGYELDLDELTEVQLSDGFERFDAAQLLGERQLRAHRRLMGRCDYCNSAAGFPIFWSLEPGGQIYVGGDTCKFPERHNDPAAIANRKTPGRQDV